MDVCGPDGTFAYVADHDQQVLRVDTATNAVTDDLHYMSGRWVEAVSPDNTYVYAAHYVTPAMNGVVRRIDAATNTFVGSDIAVEATSLGCRLRARRDFALVVNGGRHRLADRDGLRYGDRDDRRGDSVAISPGRHIRVREQHQPRLGPALICRPTPWLVPSTWVTSPWVWVQFRWIEGLYVANANSGTVSEIDTATDAVVRTITMPGRGRPRAGGHA